MKFYPNNTDEQLEFLKVKELLLGHCLGELGINQINKAKFYLSLEPLNKHLSQVSEMQSIIVNGFKFPAQNYYSLSEEIKQLQVDNNVLEGKQFRRIAAFASTISDVFEFFKKFPEEHQHLREILDDQVYEAAIAKKIDAIIDEKGVVYANASPELMRIRRQLNSKNSALQKVFGKLVQQYKLKGILSDSSESIRNNRRVLSVQAESKRTINGIVHDESDSGKTSYIEPQETVLLNNELFELERAEKREVYKILQQLTAEISIYAPLLGQHMHLLGYFDAIRAKALLAIQMDAHKPVVEKTVQLDVKEAYHPLLFLLNKQTKKPTVPLEVKLDSQQRILLISGPNAGGKSVALKTIGLMQMMLQFGLLIPCDENSKFCIFNKIFTDLGDSQSIENELSTYSARLTKMKHFTEESDSKTLFLIDEFGTGTDPRFGAAMAEAILLRMIKSLAFGVVTTHYSNLKKIGEEKSEILNGAMLFNEQNFAPTYLLKTGKPGSSYTFAIAQRIGMEKALIEEAKSYVDYSDLKFDELIAKVEKERKSLAQENSKIKAENKQLKILQRKFENLNTQLDKQMSQYRTKMLSLEQEKNERVQQEVNTVLNKINKAKSKEKALIETKKLLSMKHEVLKEKAASQPISLEDWKNVKPGDAVSFKGNEGEIIEMRGKKAVVNLNGLKSTVSLEELELINASKKQEHKVRRVIKKDPMVNTTFDIRGLSHDSAYVQIEQYMDQALLNNLQEIKIIHGKGMGILRKLVQRVVREYKSNILQWKYEEEKKGGDGATIIQFK